MFHPQIDALNSVHSYFGGLLQCGSLLIHNEKTTLNQSSSLLPQVSILYYISNCGGCEIKPQNYCEMYLPGFGKWICNIHVTLRTVNLGLVNSFSPLYPDLPVI